MGTFTLTDAEKAKVEEYRKAIKLVLPGKRIQHETYLFQETMGYGGPQILTHVEFTMYGGEKYRYSLGLTAL